MLWDSTCIQNWKENNLFIQLGPFETFLLLSSSNSAELELATACAKVKINSLVTHLIIYISENKQVLFFVQTAAIQINVDLQSENKYNLCPSFHHTCKSIKSSKNIVQNCCLILFDVMSYHVISINMMWCNIMFHHVMSC